MGVDKNGRVYVTEKDGMTLTGEESIEWDRRYDERFGEQDADIILLPMMKEEIAESERILSHDGEWSV